MKNSLIQYYLYARKSSEDDERQIKSIEDQISEVSEHARKLGITPSRIFTESKSAKIPGREIFNEMIKAIIKSKEPVVILAWHPDRLARNSVDGGQIIYLIDIGKIVKLEFPVFWFEPTPQGLFMLQIAFGQAKYYSDNLSENVKRGNRNKVKRGEWLCRPPFGYKRNYKTKNIDIVLHEAEIVKHLFKLFSTSKYSFSDLSRYLFYNGVKSKSGRPLKSDVVKYILTNIAYIGLIRYKNEVFEGTYDSIIDNELFDDVQNKIRRKSRPIKHISRNNFLFVRLFRCGECGEAITAQIGRGNGGTYKYYRCCKRFKCSQSYLREELLISQIREFLQTIRLPEGWYDEMLNRVRIKETEDRLEKRKLEIQLSKKLENVENKLQKLSKNFLDQIIDEREYFQTKERLLKIKSHLQKKRIDLSKNDIQYIQPFKKLVSEILLAQELALSNNYHEIISFLRRVTINRLVKDKSIFLSLVPPYDFVFKKEELWNWSPDKLITYNNEI